MVYLDIGKISNKSSLMKNDKEGFVTCRLIVAVMAYFGMTIMHCLRASPSFSIIAMVNSSYMEETTSSDECPYDNSTIHEQNGAFLWGPTLQGLVLGAFYYGYMITHLPGAWIVEKYGGKHLYGFGIFITSVLSLLSPLAVRQGVYIFIAVRIVQGFAEGVTSPALHTMLSKWAPVYERSQLVAFVFTGKTTGPFSAMAFSGLLVKYQIAGGWPSIFYIFGSLGCLWFIAWNFLIYDSPSEHPRISEYEKNHITNSIGHESTNKPPVPWKCILTSMPFWACLVSHFCNNWGQYTLLTFLPTYMKTILNFDSQENGFLSGLPFLTCSAVTTFGGFLADYLGKKEYLSTTSVRKGSNVLGLVGPGLFLICLGYIGCERILAVILLVCSIGSAGFAVSGFAVNHLDLAPSFAGTLIGITNMAATTSGFIGPQVVGIILEHDQSRAQWQIVFYISCGIYLFGAIFYVIFGSGVEQSWSSKIKINDPQIKDKCDDVQKDADNNTLTQKNLQKDIFKKDLENGYQGAK